MSILVGLGVGLYVGLVISPLEVINSSPNILRDDYKTDYVLMVSEAYVVESNPDLAVKRLERLGGSDVIISVKNAVDFGITIGLPEEDIQLMIQLGRDLENWIPAWKSVV